MTDRMIPLTDLPTWPRLMSEVEAARYVGVSRNTFRGMVGSLWPEPVPGMGRRRLYDKEALDKAVDGISLTESESPHDPEPENMGRGRNHDSGGQIAAR